MLVVWAIAHTLGLPISGTVWRPEALSVADLVLPGLEAASCALLTLAAARHSPLRTNLGVLSALALLSATITTVAFAAIGLLDVVNDAWFPTPSEATQVSAGSRTTSMYCSPDGAPLAMDLVQPGPEAARPAPVILDLPIGGWFFGDRQVDGLGARSWSDGAPLNRDLLQRGFAVASIDIRQSPLHAWPAQIEDAKCAVRFLRTNAAELGIDPDRIGTYGMSAGGQLASLLGTAGPAAGFDVGENLDQSSAVQAVVDMYGPTDLNAMQGSNAFGQNVVRFTFGDSVARRQNGSPISYVSANAPPFLILHGMDDVMVVPDHSRDLARRLQSFGVPATLVIVEGTGHSLVTPTQSPSPNDIRATIVDFFAHTLRPTR
jgi:acetyl esterase/lipase